MSFRTELEEQRVPANAFKTYTKSRHVYTLPVQFRVRVSSIKQGKNVFYVLQVSGKNPKYKPDRLHTSTITSSSTNSSGSTSSSDTAIYPYIRYDVWRTWEDCLAFLSDLEQIYSGFALQTIRKLKSDNKKSVVKPQVAAASFVSLPTGRDPNAVPKSIFSILPKIRNRRSTIFGLPSDETIAQNTEDFAALLDRLWDKADVLPRLVKQVREEGKVKSFFAVWEKDKERWKRMSEEIKKDKGKGRADDANTDSSAALSRRSGIVLTTNKPPKPSSSSPRESSHHRHRTRANTVDASPHSIYSQSARSPVSPYEAVASASSPREPRSAPARFEPANFAGDYSDDEYVRTRRSRAAAGAENQKLFMTANREYEQAPPSTRRRAMTVGPDSRGKGKARADAMPRTQMHIASDAGQELSVPGRRRLELGRQNEASVIEFDLRDLVIEEEEVEVDSSAITSVPWLHGPPRNPNQRPNISSQRTRDPNVRERGGYMRSDNRVSTQTPSLSSTAGSASTTTLDTEPEASAPNYSHGLQYYFPGDVWQVSRSVTDNSYVDAFYVEHSGVVDESSLYASDDEAYLRNVKRDSVATVRPSAVGGSISRSGTPSGLHR